jgi:hypothetical protein
LGAAFDDKGGKPTLAAPITSGGDAQEAEFARFGPFPDSRLSCRMRRKPGKSPNVSRNGDRHPRMFPPVL